MGAFVYENGTENPIGIVGVIISMLGALIASGLGALIYSVPDHYIESQSECNRSCTDHIWCRFR